MKNIHLLPTDKPSRLAYDFDKLILNSRLLSPILYKTQNIYITNDEEIKEGDWFLQTTYEGIFKCSDAKIEYIYFDIDNYEPIAYCKKIILTTDQDLIKDGVQIIDDEFLEWFVKNPSCGEVNTQLKLPWESSKDEYEIIIPKEEWKCCGAFYGCDKCEHKKEEPKQETLEEVAEKLTNDFPALEVRFNMTNEEICSWFLEALQKGAKWQQERIYSEEDLKEAFGMNNKDWICFEEWFEQFKKK